MKRILITFLISLLISSCDDSGVWFESPQPEGKKELAEFPRKLTGKYLNCRDQNDTLIIESNQITSSKHFVLVNHIDSLKIDSNIKIDRTDTTKLKQHLEKENLKVSISGDSVYGRGNFKENVFQLSSSNVLKKHRGDYFLNYQESDENWLVQRVILKKDSLFIEEIEPSDKLSNYDFISHLKEDNTSNDQYLIRANKKELEQLIREGFFQKNQCFCKVKDQ